MLSMCFTRKDEALPGSAQPLQAQFRCEPIPDNDTEALLCGDHADPTKGSAGSTGRRTGATSLQSSAIDGGFAEQQAGRCIAADVR